MVTLFDEQTIRDIHDYNIAKDAREEGLQEGLREGLQKEHENGVREGIQQGIEQGIQRGIQRGIEQGREQERENSIREVVLVMRKLSADRKFVIQHLTNSFGLSTQAAEEKVDLYWNEN